MSPQPFPDDGPGAPEPAGPGVPADDWGAEDWGAEDWEALDAAREAAGEWEVPPEWRTGDLTAQDLSEAGFGDSGQADLMPPGPVLATLVDAAAGATALAGLSDDELVGVIAAARRTESRVVWAGMAAVAEFAARRQEPSRGGGSFGADELAARLNLTWQSAAGQLAYAETVARRLPKTFAALAAGLIHPVHVRIIEEETGILSDADTAAADERLAVAAQSMTFGQLRYAARRLVLKLDPDAVRRRKEQARKDAHVRRFQEGSGNAGMVAREMPAAEVLASWQHVEQRALDLRAAGLPGTLQELRVRAYLDLLQEQDTRAALPSAGPGPAGEANGEPGDDPQDGPGGNGGPGGGSGAGPGSGTGPSLAALVNITVPLATVQGQSPTPGEAAGFGLLDPGTAADLVAAAARNPRTRWCLTVLHPDGTAAAHGCAAGPHPGPPPLSSFRLHAVIRGPCDHAQGQHRYRPGRELRHLIGARSARCTAPGCSRPAAACDLDHTTPWHHGGPTCPCNLSPLCRHHHRCKQAEGWWLDQPEPGVLVWRTPTGRRYTTTPTEYPT